jgi:hypothetical protein
MTASLSSTRTWTLEESPLLERLPLCRKYVDVWKRNHGFWTELPYNMITCRICDIEHEFWCWKRCDRIISSPPPHMGPRVSKNSRKKRVNLGGH